MSKVWKGERRVGKYEIAIFPYMKEKKKKSRRLKIIKCISTLAILVVQCMHRRTGPNSTERIVS